MKNQKIYFQQKINYSFSKYLPSGWYAMVLSFNLLFETSRENLLLKAASKNSMLQKYFQNLHKIFCHAAFSFNIRKIQKSHVARSGLNGGNGTILILHLQKYYCKDPGSRNCTAWQRALQIILNLAD